MIKKYYQIFITVITVVLIMVMPGKAHANEGRFSLKNSYVDCEGISIWQGSTYQISGKCNGLVYPYHDQLTQYSLWVIPDAGGNPKWISNIDKGLITGNTVNKFTGMFVTAESDSGPQNPSSTQIVSGNLDLYNFPLPYQNQVNQPDQSNQNQVVSPITPTPAIATSSAFSTFAASRFITFPVLIIVAIAVVIIVILFSFR
jgi:hypothetical protein